MVTRRFQNWPVLLAEFVQSHIHSPFEWGKNDCCLFACDWINLATGIDPAANIRGKYDSALSAARVLGEFGGVQGVAESKCIEHGFPVVNINFSQRGDIVTNLGWTGESLGVCIGAKSAFTGKDGLELYPTLSCVSAWSLK